MVRLSPAHGLNPALEQCFLCGEDVGVVLFGHLRSHREYRCRSCGTGWTVCGEVSQCPSCKSRSITKGEYVADPEAPRRVCLNKKPCAKCEGFMKQGIILISVDEEKSKDDPQNPYRTGGWVVVTEDFIRRTFGPDELLQNVLRMRVAFMPDDAWDKLGLPRGESNAQTIPREGATPAGEEREVVGDLMGNDWREAEWEPEWGDVFPRMRPLDFATDEEREGVKMIVFLQKLDGTDESEKTALAGWRKMGEHDREQTRLAYRALNPNLEKPI